MKALLNIIVVFILISFVSGCKNKTNQDVKNKEQTVKPVDIDFDIVLTGTYMSQEADSICGEEPMIRVVNQGTGFGVHFGKLISYFDFCVDTSDGTYPQDYMEAYLEDQNGDRIFIRISGQVLQGRDPQMPEDAISYFIDPIDIIGGTGIFEGATGSGVTSDYNSSKDPYSHHRWKGTITLKKGV